MTTNRPKVSETKKIRLGYVDEPSQSDATLLLKVEDLIHMAMGPPELNIVNFKLIQTILFILAREMRMLNQQVEIRATEVREAKEQGQEDLGGGRDKESTDDDSPRKRDEDTKKKEKKSKGGGEDRVDKKGKDSDYEEGTQQKDKSGKQKREKESPERIAGKKVEDSSEKVSTVKKKMEKKGKSGKSKNEYESDDDKGYSKEKGKIKDKYKSGDQGKDDDDAVTRRKEAGKADFKEGSGRIVKAGETGENAGEGRGKSPKGKEVREKKSHVGAGIIDDSGVKTDGSGKNYGVARGRGGTAALGGQPLRVGSIEVVSQKQFAVLESAVKALQDQASLPPPPTLPDNRKLRAEIVKGNASLTDTMQAMQLSARVQAAEKAISTMADLLTQLSAAGALPQEIASQAADIQGNIEAIRQDIEDTGTVAKYSASATSKKSTAGVWPTPSQGTRKSVTIDLMASQTATAGVMSLADASTTSHAAMRSSRSIGGGPMSIDSKTTGVTRPEMDEALQMLKDDILKMLITTTQRATIAADTAHATIKGVSDKMNIALKLESRISFLQSLVGDYAEQLHGFGTGLSSQMTGFQEQMAQMRQNLSTGLVQLQQVNNNAETAAVLELTERYEGLVHELDGTLHSHQGLTTYQRQLSDELKSLVECVEMMREQKADRDEVLDGLKDKADSSRLAGLVSDEQFQEARQELEMRIQMCYDKFRKQDAVWMKVINDFSDISENKAELMQLLGAREEAQDQLRDLHLKVQQLQRLLGEPKAALLTRMLAKDGLCAACRVPALMEPTEPVQPASLPAARTQPAAVEGLDEPCLTAGIDLKKWADLPGPIPHMCLRWVGGSHTLTAAGAGRGNVSRDRATSGPAFVHPVSRYLGYGTDGKLYKLEEELDPCVECNKFSMEKPPEKLDEAERIQSEVELPGDGSGDQVMRVVDMSTARRVTMVDDNQRAVGEGPRRAALVEGGRRSVLPDGAARRATIVEDPTTMEGASRRSTYIDAARTSTAEEESLYPSMQHRASLLIKTSNFAAEDQQRPGEVGSVVRGRVTVVDEAAAERAAMLHQIQADRADQLARAGGDEATETDV